ncbi:hypothetical protein ACLB2K_049506 [Fragaria x ananassa]
MITPAITHASAGHLIFNMIGLCYFGRNIGRVFGPEVLLKLYIAGAIVGSVFHLVHHAFLYQTTPVQEEEDSDSEEAVVDWSDGLCLCDGRDSRTGGVWNPGGLCSRGRGRGVFERKREREEGDREQGAGKEGEIQREQGRRAKYRRRAKHRG